MARPIGTCRLCKEVRPLCRSHIVPELAYAPIKNDKDQMLTVGSNGKKRKIQTGHFERLLCCRCERILAGYEDKFKKVWMDTIPPDFRHLRPRPLEDGIEVRVQDYDSFKLFHLSVFWRAAVSSAFSVSKISLGPHEKIIAEMIRNGDPGEPGVFPFFGFLILKDDMRPMPIVTQLAEAKDRYNGYRTYFMTYAFCDWFFVIARHPHRKFAEEERRCRDKKVFLLHTVPYRQSRTYTDVLPKLMH